MRILAHRGYWNQKIEANSFFSFQTALSNNFGFESDVRDYLEKIVISHNIATKDSINIERIFNLLSEYDDKYTFAINVKADGLKEYLKEYLTKYKISNYFLFDMSIPQMVEFIDYGLRVFTRQSEYEITPCLYAEASGVWLDAFKSSDWITQELIQNHINNSKEICIVSPELHNKVNYLDFWKKIKTYNLDLKTVMLCTDHPDEARSFFNE